VVGIGLNVTNHPENTDPALAGEVTCLAELVPHPPSFTALIVRLLAALTREHHRLELGDASGLCHELNDAWSHRLVQVTMAGGNGAILGHLDGVDPAGALLVRDDAGEVRVLPAPRVEFLREVFPT
jgi:biotin-(acetyl-CoA carboxylase) ligase